MATLHTSANPLLEEALVTRAKILERELNADILLLSSPINFGLDNSVRDVVEERKASGKTRDRMKLAVILQTTGGFIEVVQRISDVFRHHYEVVDFYVPDYAFSAGTVLALSGDAIFMDYHSVLGPIDPQVQKGDDWMPALGYVIQYQRLLDKSAAAASGNGPDLTRAEVAVLLSFDQAELYGIEQARNLSVTLLRDWLVKYKFKNWNKTENRQVAVTDKMRRDRAEEIANKLNDTAVWHSHGRGISMKAAKENLNLKIEDYNATPGLGPRIRTYHGLLHDFIQKVGFRGAIHTAYSFVPIL